MRAVHILNIQIDLSAMNTYCLCKMPCCHVRARSAICRRHNADKKTILYTAVAYAVMAAWGVFTQTTAGTQPLIASTVIGGASNVWKLQQIFPPGPSGSSGSSGDFLSGQVSP